MSQSAEDNIFILLHREQCVESEFSSLELSAWHEYIKRFVDYFVVKYYNLIYKRCWVASKKMGLGKDVVDDLVSECVIQSYKIARRFDPDKGDIVKFLIGSLWNHSMRNDYYKRYKPSLSIEIVLIKEVEVTQVSSKGLCRNLAAKLQYKQKFFAKEDAERLNSLILGLDWHERMLLNCKLVLGLNNCQIAESMGLVESTIRYRLSNILGKLKVSDDMLE